MKNFEFCNPVRIIFGRDQLYKLPALIPSGQRILLIYGGGSIKKNGVYDKIAEALKDYEVFEFSGIEPNPRYETCMKAAEMIREKKIDFLLAAGGGSVIDAAKFIAAAAVYEAGDPWDILSKGAPVKKSVPLGSVLTLPATGSEMNTAAVITRESTHEKFGFLTPHSYPKFSFLLPDAAATLPQRQVANGVVDAYIHVIEQYLTFPADAPLQDRFAESILQTLIEVGPKACANPADYEAMSNLMWCATMALNGLIGVAVPQDWSVHEIGHELTALHEIDHGRTLAIVLPGLWSVFRNEKKEKLLQYADRVWGLKGNNENEVIDAAIEKTVGFFESLGIKTKLSDYDVPSSTIDTIVKRFEDRGGRPFGDRRMVTPAKVREILSCQLA